MVQTLHTQSINAATVNISGRQRMLCQRSAMFCLQLVCSHDPKEQQYLRQQLQELTELMEQSHQGLIYGSEALDLPGNPSAVVKAMYFEPPLRIDRQMNDYIGAIRTLLQVREPELTPKHPTLQDIITAASHPLLGALDAVVNQYQAESDSQQAAIDTQRQELYNETYRAAAAAQTQAWELEQTLQELHKAQTQLVQTEKMSSLGQLVGGIAHEINNPINFVHGNLKFIQQYVKDLLEVVQLYQRYYPDPVEAIQAQAEMLDLDFLLDDLPKVLESVDSGTHRVRQIIGSLRNFSRLDEAELKTVQVHEGIDSTLLILQHRLKGHNANSAIEVLKNYDKLPLVECYPGQLNQCLLNILTNAIDAVEALESNHSFNTYRVKRSSLDHTSFEPTSFEPNWNRDRQPTTKQIRISTRVVDYRWIEITIADNGVGVPKGIQGKIFNPFFSTKPIGQGTGMGLSISYQIITEQHGGRLECTSETGEGSTFRILIPIAQTMQNAA